MTERLTAVQRAHRAIEEMAEMEGGDPSQEAILARVVAAMNPPTYPEPTENGARVANGFFRDNLYQLCMRNGELQWTNVASGEVVEWWEICDRGVPQILTATPIEAVAS